MTLHALPTSGRPIDPLAPTPRGRYEDDLVVVRSSGVVAESRPPGTASTDGVVRTPHFDVRAVRSRLRVDHHIPPGRVDDDLAGLISEELFAPGWVRGLDMFERVFTGIVLSSAPDPEEAWEGFYRKTISQIEAKREPRPGAEPTGHGSIADYAPIHEHVGTLLGAIGPVDGIELGSCFGFLSLGLERRGLTVTASDVAPGTMRLVSAIAPRLGSSLGTVVADAARYPAPDDSADVVLAIHLLEHLEPEHGDRVVREAVRLARRAVVVAVPFEDEPTEAYGHVRTVTVEDLRRWGRESGLPHDVHEHHGGWLVIDTSH